MPGYEYASLTESFSSSREIRENDFRRRIREARRIRGEESEYPEARGMKQKFDLIA